MPESSTERQDQPPFIASQRIRRLQLDQHQRHQAQKYLQSLPDDALEAEKSDGGKQKSPDQPRNSEQEQRWKCWVEVPDRFQFLADTSARKLCITVAAGVGKTKAVEQLLVARQHLHPEHLVVHCHVSDLPLLNADGLLAAEYFVQRRNGAETMRCLPTLVQAVLNKFGALDAATRQRRRLPEKSEWKAIQAKLLFLARIGHLTVVVDGLDEIDQESGRDRLSSLKQFLSSYPKVCCVVAGRPYSISEYYWQFFTDSPTEATASSDWEFCLVSQFTEAEVDAYVGKERADLMRRHGVRSIFVPRTLEMVRTFSHDEVRTLHSAGDIYWLSIQNTLTRDLRTQDGQRRTWLSNDDIIDALSAIAITMLMWGHDPENPRNRLPGLKPRKDGAPPISPIRQAITSDFALVKEYSLIRLARLSNRWKDRAEKVWDELICINSSLIDFSFFQSADANHLHWRNPTIRDFLAAVWMTRSSSSLEKQWGAERQWIRDSRLMELQDFWECLCGMHRQAAVNRGDGRDRWAECIEPLFHRSKHVRPTELMYRAWPNLLRRTGYLDNADWNELDLEQATLTAQRAVESQYKDRNQAKSAGRANSVLYSYLSDYLLQKHADGKPGQIIREDFEDQLIPCGAEAGKKFLCGHKDRWDNEEQFRELAIPFKICVYPVTNRFYALFDGEHRERFEDYQDYSPYERGPVICLDWYSANMFSVWCHGMLPTEWEWEYASRGGYKNPDGSQPRWYFGDDESRLPDHAWIYSNSEEQTPLERAEMVRASRSEHAHIVGQKEPLIVRHEDKEYRLYDMLGNVWEWTSSLYDERHVFRSVRGGSFNTLAINACCSNRINFAPSDAIQINGVRVTRAVF